jgi:prepilin-type N-terminal cleavage/methylation domain-containing protein
MTDAFRDGGGRRGFTLIEVMAALLIFGIGLLGIMAMEIVSTKGNRDAHDLTVGTTIAEWWMERLRTESLMWTTSYTDLTAADAPMMFTLGSGIDTQGSTTGWVAPPNNPRYDKWLRTAVAAADPGEFCTQVRLTTLVPNEIVRAEVRVMWYKNPHDRAAGWNVCPTGMLGGGGNPEITVVSSVTLSSALWRYHFR